MSDKKEHEFIRKIDQSATAEYLYRRNMLILEAAVGCLLDSYRPEEVSEILRDYAKIIENY